jgi:hypothetical protein
MREDRSLDLPEAHPVATVECAGNRYTLVRFD